MRCARRRQQIHHLGEVILTRVAEFQFEGTRYAQDESYFLVRVDRFAVNDASWTTNERRVVVEHRWWTQRDLRATSDVVYPEGLCDLIAGPHPPTGKQ